MPKHDHDDDVDEALRIKGKIEAQKLLNTITEERIKLRDRFAEAALPGLLAACNPGSWNRDGADHIANQSYLIADAMLEARRS